ncbi:hypothetical protein HY745_09010 [Candidatus Desantisbacteria bacterium]|nr:hypothetical protein [Candidatus Desantisbacteria bacterium]
MNTEFSFAAQNFADITSKLIIFNPNILYRLVSTSFISQSEKRKYPVQIARAGSSDEISEIKIPDGYEIEELPKNFEIKEDFAYYKINCYFKDGIIYLSRHSETNSILLPPESYPRFKKFYETVAYKDNEKVVLRKIN